MSQLILVSVVPEQSPSLPVQKKGFISPPQNFLKWVARAGSSARMEGISPPGVLAGRHLSPSHRREARDMEDGSQGWPQQSGACLHSGEGSAGTSPFFR